MNDMRNHVVLLKQTISDLHQTFPFVDKQNLMKVIMILFRGSVNPAQVEQFINEAFGEY